MKRLIRNKYIWAVLVVLVVATLAYAGTPALQKYGLRFQDEGAAHSTPPSGYAELYVYGDALYFIDDGGNITNLESAAATAWDDIGDPDAAGTIAFGAYGQTITSTKTDGDMLNIQGLGAFGDVSVVRIEQKTGNATDGTVLEVVSADTDVDALVVTANGANSLVVAGSGNVNITGGTGVINYTDFDVSADGAVVLSGDDGGTMLTFTPGAAAVAIDASNATITTALSVGGNDIVGTTGLINYTNFDVDASGNIVSTGNLTAVNGTFSGNVNITGTFQQDSITAATAATTLTVDGTGVGGVTIGGTSTGAVTLGGAATLVNLPANTDLVLAGGDLTITDTANADVVQITNNTLTTADVLQISASGTRTSDNVIKITDGATTAGSIAVTANAQTSGNGYAYGNTGAALTGAAYYASVTDGAGFTGYYFQAYDGAANDFTVGRYGATTIAGNASTDVLTVTAGDLQITAGDIDIDLGIITVDNTADEGNRIARNNANGAAPVLEVEQTHATGGIALLVDTKNTTAAEYAIDITSSGATQLHFTANGAAGDGMLYDATDAWTGQAFKIDAGPWLGTLGEGAALDFRSDNAATAEAGHVIYVKMQGTGADAAAIDGKGLYLEDEAGATAGSYLAKLDTKSNTVLHIHNSGAAADGIKIDVADSYTGQGFVADLGPWLGTSGEGFISLASDNAATVPAGQFLRFRQLGTGQHAAAIAGSLLYLEDDAVAPAAGTSYAVYIDATNIEAMHVDTGKVLVDETVTATGGISAGSAATSLLKTDVIALSNADLDALNGTPKVLVASPGAGYWIEVVSVKLIHNYAGTNVWTETDDNLVVQYTTSGDDITAAIEMTGFIDQAADMIMTVFPVHPQAANALTDVVANSVELFNPNDNFGGNAGNDNTMTVIVTYWIHDDGV